MKKILATCNIVLAALLFWGCSNEENTPKDYKIYWDITNYSYEPSAEINFLLSTFDEYIGQGSADSISNHTFIVRDIKYAEYKRLREETVSLGDQADAWLRDNWEPQKRYRVRIYCYCPDDYDYYNPGTTESTEVWASYSYKKSK